MIHLGFTGTRYGMTHQQYMTVKNLLLLLAEEHGPLKVHHGACVGADAEFHELCMRLGYKHIAQVYQHLPRDQTYRAYLQGGIMEYPADYDDRNQAIVDASDYVMAAPLQEEPQVRGGTWQTVRFSQTKGNLWRIVFPSGLAVKG